MLYSTSEIRISAGLWGYSGAGLVGLYVCSRVCNKSEAPLRVLTRRKGDLHHDNPASHPISALSPISGNSSGSIIPTANTLSANSQWPKNHNQALHHQPQHSPRPPNPPAQQQRSRHSLRTLRTMQTMARGLKMHRKIRNREQEEEKWKAMIQLH